jgi:hypothetical protein
MAENMRRYIAFSILYRLVVEKLLDRMVRRLKDDLERVECGGKSGYPGSSPSADPMGN